MAKVKFICDYFWDCIHTVELTMPVISAYFECNGMLVECCFYIHEFCSIETKMYSKWLYFADYILRWHPNSWRKNFGSERMCYNVVKIILFEWQRQQILPKAITPTGSVGNRKAWRCSLNISLNWKLSTLEFQIDFHSRLQHPSWNCKKPNELRNKLLEIYIESK